MEQKKERVIIICLDAFDAAVSEKLIAEGKLKALAKFKENSACFDLEHGDGGLSRYTGLTWEHFTSGLKPETTNKWSVISFDSNNYGVLQTHATLKPFLANMDIKVVALDPPYYDLEQSPNTRGVVGWGGHDTGMYLASSPPDLYQEITDKFGPQLDHTVLNTMIYNDAEATKTMANSLCESVTRRTEIAKWLFNEKFDDWDVALLGYAETHDVIELMFHGIYPDHHAADFDSVPFAKQGIEMVYEAVSNSIEDIQNTFPDASIVAFTMHGMGFNDTDLPTMILLPELMYRMEFDKPFFHAREDWKSQKAPALKIGESWQNVVNQCLYEDKSVLKKVVNKVSNVLSSESGKYVCPQEKVFDQPFSASDINILNKRKEFSVKWMPGYRYKENWPKMKAFGLPAYFDGRVRINLKGREENGIVALEDYESTINDIVKVLQDCRDTKTGEPVVKEMSFPGKEDPLSLCGTQADIKIIWNGSPMGFRHPKYGDIGPAPIRRVGGHSGDLGALYVNAPSAKPGKYGKRSSFDVAPTVVGIVGKECKTELDGEDLISGDAKV